MAIMRLDPKAIFKIISQYDDALLNETDEELTSIDENGAVAKKKSRYSEYLDADFDESKLKFKEGAQPDRILMRVLTADEYTSIFAKYTIIDPTGKKTIYKDRDGMFLKMFQTAFQGVQGSDGSVSKPACDELPPSIQIEMGANQTVIVSLGKHRKK